MREFFTTDALQGSGDGRRADGVGHLARDAGHRARCADVRDAPRRHRRPTGRRQWRGAADAARRVRSCWRHGARRHARLRRSRARAMRFAVSTLHRRHRDHRARSSCRRAIRTTPSCRGCATRRRRRADCASAGGRFRTTRATSRRSTRDVGVPHLRLRSAGRSTGDATDHVDRAVAGRDASRLSAMMASGRRARSARECSPTSRRLPTRRSRPQGRHVLSLETLFTPYGLPGGWAGSGEPQRWLDLFATVDRARLRRARRSSGGR